MKTHTSFSSFVLAVFCSALLCGAAGCNKDKRDIKTPLLENAVQLSADKDPEKLKLIYTAATISAAEKYSQMTGGTDILSGMDRKLFASGSKWDIVEETKNGTSAKVIIQITAHPARNMIGYRAEIPMRYEDGAWRIDRADTIKKVLKNLK